jgi:hypothetical protein
VGVGLGVAVLGGLAFVLFGRGTSGDAAKAPVAAAPAPAPVAPPPAPPEKTTVTVRFEASPTGSHVFRKSDGTDLGVAPLELKLPHNGPATEFLLRKDGFKELGVTADLSSDNTVHVALEKLEAPAPPPAATRPEPARRPAAHRAGGRHRAGAAPDEDGLATPSF